MNKYFLIVSLMLGCCQTNNQANNPSLSDPKPNIIIPNDINYCKQGCEYLASLKNSDGTDGCPESKTIQERDGKRTTCEEFCIDTEKNGREINPKCWLTLKSCDEIEACRKDN